MRVVTSIGRIDASAWDALDHGGAPFLRHGFLRALEESRSVGGRSGWDPRYLVVDAPGGGLAGALAAYVKTHSYGEFIFDWEWARASQRAGIRYYPKLVVAAPMTPATGPRLLLARGAGAEARRATAAALAAGLREVADQERCSSIHVLFPPGDEATLWGELGFAVRASYQFHWHRRGESTFEDFLARMTSRRRKQARKERARARAAVDAIDLVPARDLGADDLAAMDAFYRDNVDAHGGSAYLEPGFFERAARAMPDQMLMARAMRAGRVVAGALFFEGDRGLYGRYWGAREPIPNLHFEMTCWLGIERAIARGLPLYEAGAQGGHKLLRGLEPSPTWSAHWLRHPGLDAAIRAFVEDEAQAVAHHMARLARVGPFKGQEEPPADLAEEPPEDPPP